MTEQEHPWETVPEQDAVPETSPAENTDTPDTPIAVSNLGEPCDATNQIMQFCRRTSRPNRMG